MADAPALGEVDTPESFGTGEGATAQRWISELDIAEKEEAQWLRRGRKIIQRYKDERLNGKGGSNAALVGQRRFAILWANVQTLGPAIYARTPTAVVSRRFKDADPVGRMASEVLERALNYSLEEYDFDEKMVLCRQDYLLPGRGSLWVRYVPTFKTVKQEDDGKTVANDTDDDITGDEDIEEIDYEQVVCDHVAWTDFCTNPAREWSEVRWVARRAYLTRTELKERFPKVGAQIPLDWSPKNYKDDGDHDSQFKKAIIYELWDKESRKAYWVSKVWPKACLDERDDPLKLTDFFPCPKPVYATLGSDSLVPVPDYVLYQDQAEELDELTARIGYLTDALRMVGFYAGEAKTEIARVFQPGNENKLIPLDSWAAFAERGGVKGLIEWVPVDMVMETLRGCFETRQQIINDIYQITGISDIMRGESDPNETAAAQQIKGNFGSVRVRDRAKDMARLARDAIRIKGEIIAEQFSIGTLKKMTGVQMLDSPEQKQQITQQIQMQAQQAQQMGQPPQKPPQDLVDMLQRPTWSEVKGLLEDNALRSFRIEIETDSTIEPNDAEQKSQAVEFLTAIGQLLANGLPAVQQAPPLGKLVGESVKFLTRRFRVGREMEETIDQVMAEIGNMPPPAPQNGSDPNAVPVAQAQIQSEQIKGQSALQLEQIKQQTAQITQQGETARAQLDAQMQAAELPVRRTDQQLKLVALQKDPEPQANA